MFSQPQIERTFEKFVTVRLSTVGVPAGERQVPDDAGAAAFRDEKFQNYALPYYVVLRVKGKTLYKVGAYDKGVIADPAEFEQFLEAARQVKVP